MYHYAIAIALIIFIILYAIYLSQNVEGFWNRESLLPIPIPPPTDYPQYVNPDYRVNQYMYNTQLSPYTPSYLNEVAAQQVQLRPWLYSSRNFPTYFPNYQLPAQVIGCGGRRGACLGGVEQAIPNILPPIDISDRNIAPVNLTVRGFDNGVQVVGIITKIFAANNEIFPLYGQREYPNENRWRYYTRMPPYGTLVPVFRKGKRHYGNNYCMEQLSTGEPVWVESLKDEFRCTIYDDSIPQYLPIV